MGIALRAGRDLTTQDREGAPRVALVNEALARQLPGPGSVVGRHIGYGIKPGDEVEIVGVVADARFASLRDPAPPTLYLPYRQYSQHRMTFAVRTAGDSVAVVPAIRRVGEAIDPNVPIHEVRTQEAQIDATVRQERLFAYVASGFALLAVVLASLGIYGTLGYSVARRTAEIGLRMALGADRQAVVRMVLRESLVPVVIGLVVGLGTAAATTRFLESMLFGLTPNDRTTVLLATAALVASALIAAWLPSRRASAVDPMTALRSE
jgi:predicted permease